MPEIIDQSSFAHWRRHPVTERLFQMLLEIDEGLKEILLNPSIVLEPQGQIHYSRVIGNRELIDRVLNITFEEIEERKEDNGNIEDRNEI